MAYSLITEKAAAVVQLAAWIWLLVGVAYGKPVSVPRGQSVYIDPRDLGLTPVAVETRSADTNPADDIQCVVTVVTDDPSCLKVGTVQPQVVFVFYNNFKLFRY